MIHSLSQFLYSRFSHRVLSIAWAALVITVILATVFSFPEKAESPRERRLIAVFGFFVFIFVLYSTSTVKKRMGCFI
jgi:CNT family concentrative nucleoside transporter